jgi:hypothetical protein
MKRSSLDLLFAVLFLASSTFAADKLDVCGCKPRDEKPTDYRFAAKHIPLPDMQPQTISVQEMLGWDQSANLRNDAPRKGRELQLVTIPRAYVQFAWAYRGDCDIHIEISETPDKDAPRAIVETPVDPEYCAARKTLQSALSDHGVELSVLQQEVSNPFPVSVRGLPYQDAKHKRGSVHVATVWEIHPAILEPIGEAGNLSPSDRRLVGSIRSTCNRTNHSNAIP